MSEIFIPLVVLNLILPQLCFCGILYMVWWLHRPFLIPFLFTIMILIISFVFKFAFGRVELVSPFQNCLLLTIPGFTLPSVHAGIGFYLCFHFSQKYLKKKTPQIIQLDLISTNWPRLKVVIIWCFFIGMCISRVYLVLNRVLDIIIGGMVGCIAVSIERYFFIKSEKKWQKENL